MRTRWKGTILRTAVLLLLLGVALPMLVKVNFWREEVEAALSAGLGHPVRAGDVRLKLLGGIGFEIEKVIVEEDPRFGIEPLARVETVQAIVAPRSLWKWRIEYSKLNLLRPRLNAVRNGAGEWNLAFLSKLSGSVGDGKPGGGPTAGISREALPRINVESGRINFKAGDRKTVYVIDDVDLELFPPRSAEEPWSLRFEGTPDRMDQSLRAASRMQGQAEFGPFSSRIRQEAGAPIRLDVVAENALLSDLARIVTGRDLGIHGSLDLRCHLAGTTSLLRVSGTADLRGLHRWDLLPPAAASVLHGEITGVLDVAGNSLQLTSLSIPLAEGSAVMQGRIEKVLERPQPNLQLQLHRLSLDGLLELARPFTTRLDRRFTAQGSLEGRLQLEGGLGTLTGELNVIGGVLREEGTPQPARFSDFTVAVADRAVALGPVTLRLGSGGTFTGSLHWDWEQHSSSLLLRGEKTPLASFSQWARAFGSPLGRANFAPGSLDLEVTVTMAAGTQPEVSGWAQISDAVLHSAAVNQPIEVASARLTFLKDRTRVDPFAARLGAVELQGSFSAEGPLPLLAASGSETRVRWIEFDCQAPAIDLADLDQLFHPRYRSAPLFGFGGRAESSSSFFDSFIAHGTLQAGQVSYRDVVLRNAQASLGFHDRLLEIPEFAGEFAGGGLSGKATVFFGSGAPSFTVESRYSNLQFEELSKPAANSFLSGTISGEFHLAGSGATLEEILERFAGFGEATGRNLTFRAASGATSSDGAPNHLSPIASHIASHIASMSSAFQVRHQEIVFTPLKAAPVPHPRAKEDSKPPAWTLSGTVGLDRALDLRAKEPGAGREFRWTGTLADPQLEIRPSVSASAVNASISGQ